MGCTMNYSSRRFFDIKKNFIKVTASNPFLSDNKLHKWCANHVSDGCYTYGNSFSTGGNPYTEVWFELEVDAVLCKLKFA